MLHPHKGPVLRTHYGNGRKRKKPVPSQMGAPNLWITRHVLYHCAATTAFVSLLIKWLSLASLAGFLKIPSVANIDSYRAVSN